MDDLFQRPLGPISIILNFPPPFPKAVWCQLSPKKNSEVLIKIEGIHAISAFDGLIIRTTDNPAFTYVNIKYPTHVWEMPRPGQEAFMCSCEIPPPGSHIVFKTHRVRNISKARYLKFWNQTAVLNYESDSGLLTKKIYLPGHQMMTNAHFVPLNNYVL